MQIVDKQVVETSKYDIRTELGCDNLQPGDLAIIEGHAFPKYNGVIVIKINKDFYQMVGINDNWDNDSIKQYLRPLKSGESVVFTKKG